MMQGFFSRIRASKQPSLTSYGPRGRCMATRLLANLRNRNRTAWPLRLVRQVAGIVRIMPLWKLQTIGQERADFLYENDGDGQSIELRPGGAFCLRKFHALVSDQVRGAWLRYVRRQNLGVLGETADLNEFLFGSERNNLAVVRPILMDIQRGRCFYCNDHRDHRGDLRGTGSFRRLVSVSDRPWTQFCTRGQPLQQPEA